MAALEGACGALSARRLDGQRAAGAGEGARGLCRGAGGGGDADAYYYANERFHRAIYAASRNAYLADEARQLSDRLRPYRRLQLRAKRASRARLLSTNASSTRSWLATVPRRSASSRSIS